MRTQGEAEAEARRAWAEEHAPIPNPLPAVMHRQVATCILDILAENGLGDVDYLAPLDVPETLEQRIVAANAAEQAAIDAAVAVLTEIEARYAAYDAVVAQGPMSFAPPPAADQPSVADHSLITDESEPVVPDEMVRRGRGRPPRVSSVVSSSVITDESVPVLPD